jgi:hypothetical protein
MDDIGSKYLFLDLSLDIVMVYPIRLDVQDEGGVSGAALRACS